ncbi:SDR family NAD(P)-dependent oxidoreductase, partial [Nocardia pseudovaccinii]|uniref:SDR family NAD(P)-dependent oxidoreductase n=1 Tax=Nocardia pseudovaccinii TaxID=189540 RepID=UPI0007A4AC38
GIGAAAAYGFAKAGATVVIGARRAEHVEKHAAAINDFGGKALGLRLDVTDESSWRHFVDEAITRFGRIDGAFNNAGIDQKPAVLDEVSLEERRDVFAVKVDGTFLGMKYQCKAMAEHGGAIVNHGSAIAELGIGALPAPCASQAAVIGLTKSAARAYGPKIRVNLLSTGAIMTPERVGTDMYSAELPIVPAKRPGRAEEVAAVAGWLLSDYASYQTGALVAVDGGGPSWA